MCSMSCSCRVPLSICALLTSDMAAKLRQSGRRSLSECDLVQRDFRRTRDGRWRPSLDHTGSPDVFLTIPRVSTCCKLGASARRLHFAAQASGDESRPAVRVLCQLDLRSAAGVCMQQSASRPKCRCTVSTERTSSQALSMLDPSAHVVKVTVSGNTHLAAPHC